MNRFLWNLSNNYNISINRFDGGNLRNAIPREAFATIVVEKSYSEQVKNWIDSFHSIILEEFGEIEKGLKIFVKEVHLPSHVMDEDRQKRLLNSITACPHGVIAWSKEMDNLVETSTNLASVKFKKDNTIEIVTSQRSSIESSKYDVAAMVESCLSLAGAIVTHSEGYPGWRPNINSEILKITQSSYEKLFGKKPDIRAIHAGLECGLIYQKFKGIDMISIGPTIRGAHTPEEKLNIETTLMFWDLLLDILDNIPLKE
jgi:dipeptidase D